MRLAIMQPYLFPYLGYYSLIEYADEFMLFDTVQFIRHGWIERNRILKPGEGWQYIQVPLVKSPRETVIKDLQIRNSEPWREKLVAQLTHYKKRAPHYAATVALVEKALDIDTESMVALNKHILETTCDYLGIRRPLSVFSGADLEIGVVGAPDEWALEIAKARGAEEYVNPPGGQSFFDEKKYRNGGVKLTFLTNSLTPYSQRRPQFESGLSIIDVLMFNDAEAARSLIRAYELS